MNPRLPVAHPANGSAQGYGQLPPDVGQMIANYDRMLREMRGEVTDLQKQIADLIGKEDGKLAPRYIEDIPGKRVPYWWVISISIDSAISDGARWSGAATLSQDGPFVINSTRAFWRVTTQSASADADVSRAFAPVSRYPMLLAAATAAPVIDRDIIDWFFAIQLSGGDRLWQNSDMPGAVFATQGNRPEYFGMPGWVERNDTMTIQATASISSTAANAPDTSCRGTLYIVHSGYKILG